MFEQILPYQQDIASLLSQQLKAEVFPQSVLFSGQRYSGRLTITLETARVLSCSEEGKFGCRCGSCRRFDLYDMSNVVLVGNRDHGTRIAAALSIAKNRPNERSRKLLIRTVRLMLLQYHGALLDARDSKNSGIFESAAVVSEQLSALESAPEQEFASHVDRLESALKPLAVQYRRSTPLSINQVRSLHEWTMQTGLDGQVRCIILEGVEESTEGARNSLLKLLEEPPRHTYIIVLSEHPARLLPTILSRLQRYTIRPLSSDAEARLLADYFDIEKGSGTILEEFLLMHAQIPCEEIKSSAHQYAESILSGAPLSREALDRIVGELDEPVRLEYFLNQFQTLVRQAFMTGRCARATAAGMLHIASEKAMIGYIFNQNRKLLIESLYYRLQEVI